MLGRKELRERLIGLGRWDEYLERRGREEYSELKGLALRRRVLKDMGLDADGLERIEESVGRRGMRAKPGEDDISWIYRMMDEPGVRADHAPNMGAWGWLNACRDDRSLKQDFYKSIWASRVKEEASRAKRYGDDGREVLSKVEELLNG